MFALAARELDRAPSKDRAAKVVKAFTEKLRERLPSYAEFEAGLMEIEHVEESSKQRQLVRYLLARFDDHLRQDATIDYDGMTIEHLAAQSPSTGPAIKNVGLIGNLILVPPKLNKALANKSFDKKRVELKKAKVPLDQSLSTAQTWGEQEITSRTKALAKLAYEKVFRV